MQQAKSIDKTGNYAYCLNENLCVYCVLFVKSSKIIAFRRYNTFNPLFLREILNAKMRTILNSLLYCLFIYGYMVIGGSTFQLPLSL